MPLTARTTLLVLLFCTARSGGFAAEPVEPDRGDAVQMLADIALIDGECADVTVDFGRAFQAAEVLGLRPSTVMPAGALRPAFEAAMRDRLARTPHDDLCGDLARAYQAHIPGLFKGR